MAKQKWTEVKQNSILLSQSLKDFGGFGKIGVKTCYDVQVKFVPSVSSGGDAYWHCDEVVTFTLKSCYDKSWTLSSEYMYMYTDHCLWGSTGSELHPSSLSKMIFDSLLTPTTPCKNLPGVTTVYMNLHVL